DLARPVTGLGEDLAGVLAEHRRRRRRIDDAAVETRRRPRTHETSRFDERPALRHVRMQARLRDRKYRRKARVAALEDLAPLGAGLGAEHGCERVAHRGPRIAVVLVRERCGVDADAGEKLGPELRLDGSYRDEFAV